MPKSDDTGDITGHGSSFSFVKSLKMPIRIPLLPESKACVHFPLSPGVIAVSSAAWPCQ
jgi:hypothetical protein